jgi:hypothetical protein
VQIDEGNYEPVENIRFRDWGVQWRESLERKQTTIDSYKSTVDYATEAFGDVFGRRLQPAHLAKLNTLMKVVAELVRAIIGFRTVAVPDEALLLRALELYEQYRIHFAESYLAACAGLSGVGVVA